MATDGQAVEFAENHGAEAHRYDRDIAGVAQAHQNALWVDGIMCASSVGVVIEVVYDARAEAVALLQRNEFVRRVGFPVLWWEEDRSARNGGHGTRDASEGRQLYAIVSKVDGVTGQPVRVRVLGRLPVMYAETEFLHGESPSEEASG